MILLVNVRVCEREIPNIDKLGSSLGDGITYDFYLFLYTSLYLQNFFVTEYILLLSSGKKERYFFLGEKQTELLLNAKMQQRAQGEQELATGLQKLMVCLSGEGDSVVCTNVILGHS